MKFYEQVDKKENKAIHFNGSREEIISIRIFQMVV